MQTFPLFSPEHLHVLLNHLPIIGLPMGAFALLLALILRSRSAQIVALALVIVAAASALPVNLTGQRAYKPLRGIVDDVGADWLDTHMERAEQFVIVFYALASVALAAVVAPLKWPRLASPLAFTTLVLTVGCVGLSGWIALAGGQIRHPEFRTETPIRTESHIH